jgi:hypothetical protein
MQAGEAGPAATAAAEKAKADLDTRLAEAQVCIAGIWTCTASVCVQQMDMVVYFLHA